MKELVMMEVEVDIKKVMVQIPIRYGTEDIPDDFPLRRGDMWIGTIDIETGQIEGWPQGKSGEMYLKVCDEGVYELYDETGKRIATIDGYVPNKLIPGEYGDYVDFKIDEDGTITNWPNVPDVSEFFDKDEY